MTHDQMHSSPTSERSCKQDRVEVSELGRNEKFGTARMCLGFGGKKVVEVVC